MPPSQALESTLTDRYQTTVPKTVRETLKLGKRDKLQYVIQPSGEVLLRRAGSEAEDDPAIGQFLQFLADDIVKNPVQLQALDTQFLARLKALTGGIEVDLNSPLNDDDE